MEMSAIGARNVALLAYQDFFTKYCFEKIIKTSSSEKTSHTELWYKILLKYCCMYHKKFIIFIKNYMEKCEKCIYIFYTKYYYNDINNY